MYCTIGGFTLDDTVLPSGEIHWSAPGGNALYSAVGAKLWNVEVGIVARIGMDYPETHLKTLRGYGFDLRGVKRIDHPSFHVWILHEGDGKRQIIYRLESGKNTFLDPDPVDIPEEYISAKGFHICPILGESQINLMSNLLPKGVPVFLDLIDIQGQISVSESYRPDLWGDLEAFLPSIEEVRAAWGDKPLPELITCIKQDIPGVFAIKMGSQGCLVWHPDLAQIYHVPAFGADVIDATGAGDGFCGGFMVGLQETGDPIQAALMGTVSASFVIEGFGAIHALDASSNDIQDRLLALKKKVAAVKINELNKFNTNI